ncbi:MAG: hypothetical protein HY902_17050 [Deltaproteobacteria bacterium]|nr:hypothetical protein [Deltaproteobacteria bacterium]
MTDAPTAAAAEPEVEQGPQEPVLLPPPGLVWVTLAALVAVAAAAILWAPPVREVVEPSLQLREWMSDPDELAEMSRRDDALLAADVKRGAGARAAQERKIREDLAAWLTYERDLGALDVESSLPARLLLSGLQERVRTLVLTAGPDALRAMAVRYGRDVRAAIELAFDPLHAGKQDGQVDQLAPGLRATLQAIGMPRFESAGRLHPAAARVVEAMAAQRMLELGARLPERPHLPSDVQDLVLRFRIEANDALPLERRLQLLAQLAERDPTYPSVYVRGVLLARSGDCGNAIAAWEQAARMRQQAPQARANAAWCRAQLSAGAGSP